MTEFTVAGDAAWWEARKKILGGIAAQSRKREVLWTPEQKRRSECAMQCAFGDADGQIAYERNGFTKEQWLQKWNQIAAAGVAMTPYARIAQLRDFVGKF